MKRKFVNVFVCCLFVFGMAACAERSPVKTAYDILATSEIL